MNDDLANWLKEQIFADRHIAEGALEDWLEGEDGDEMASQPDSIRVGVHLVFWNPKRVLAECDVKLRIIETHSHTTEIIWRDRSQDFEVCDECGAGAGNQGIQTWPCPTVLLLALPYADRDGYREEWRP